MNKKLLTFLVAAVTFLSCESERDKAFRKEFTQTVNKNVFNKIDGKGDLEERKKTAILVGNEADYLSRFMLTPEFEELSEFQQDSVEIAKLVGHAAELNVLGGATLSNGRVDEYIAAAAEVASDYKGHVIPFLTKAGGVGVKLEK